MRCVLLLAPLLLAATACAPDAAPKPNLVLIIGDDHGYPDFGFMGSEIVQTPNLDRLAREGTLFTNAHTTASLCRPSLRSLLTGLYPIQWEHRVEALIQRGIWRGPTRWIEEFVTLPALLAEEGYASFQAGKFFERSYRAAGFTHGMVEQWKPGVSPIGRETMQPVFEFIDAHVDQPFFLWFAPVLPHVPHDAAPRYREPYANRGFSADAIGYYANIVRFDDAVHDLVGHLDAKGLRERTLIVYLSDNGWDQQPTATHPLFPGGGRKGKFSIHTLGFRTPLIVRWPGRVPAGVVSGALVSSVDLMPTLLDYAGAAPVPELPGISLRDLVEGREDVLREYLIGSAKRARPSPGHPRLGEARNWSRVAAFFLHSESWRYILFPDRKLEELYDLRADPREDHNAVGEQPILATLFRTRIREWIERMETAPAPVPEPRLRELREEPGDVELDTSEPLETEATLD